MDIIKKRTYVLWGVEMGMHLDCFSSDCNNPLWFLSAIDGLMSTLMIVANLALAVPRAVSDRNHKSSILPGGEPKKYLFFYFQASQLSCKHWA